VSSLGRFQRPGQRRRRRQGQGHQVPPALPRHPHRPLQRRAQVTSRQLRLPPQQAARLHGPHRHRRHQGRLGNPQQYKLTKGDAAPDCFDIVSLGADGKAGGEGAAADLRFSDQKPLTKDELKSSGEGIQIQLANAMGLEFQLAAIDYNREKWRNSDLNIDQLEDKLKEAGMSGGALFSMLDGSSMMSKFVGLLLNLVGSNPQMSLMLKSMMVEMLAHATS